MKKVTLVSDIDNPVRQPFQSSVIVDLKATVFEAAADLAKVPTGKLLVIEYISAAVTLPPGQNLRRIIIGPNLPSIDGKSVVQGQHFVVIAPQGTDQGNNQLFTVGQAVRLYSTPFLPVKVEVQRNSGGLNGAAQVSLSGYLVDAP